MRKPPALAEIKVPPAYSKLGADDPKESLQKSYKRIFQASGQWPWDWLPPDYVPQPQHWAAGASASMARAVEAACKSGSGVTMDDLRDFLVNQAVRYQAGTPTRRHRMNKDCSSAIEWIESKGFGSSVRPDEPEETPSEEDDQSDRDTECEKKSSCPVSSDEEDPSNRGTGSDRGDVWPVPLRTAASLTSASNDAVAWPRNERGVRLFSDFTDLGSVSTSLSTHEQREHSLPVRAVPSHIRSRSLNDTAAERYQFRVRDSAKSARYPGNPTKPVSAVPSDENRNVRRTEFSCLPAIDRDIRATDSRSDAAEKQVQRCIADIEKEKALASSISNESNQVIEMATQRRDKAQMELNQAQGELDRAQFMAIAVENKISGYEKFADGINANYNEAKAKRNKAQKDLEDITAETQRSIHQSEQAEVKVSRLENQREEHEMVVRNEVKKRTGLVAMRNIIVGLLSGERINALTIDDLEELARCTREFMDQTREPRSISEDRDI
ncbi:hypothetical protein ACHAPI_007664 [Fusarium lateritium]